MLKSISRLVSLSILANLVLSAAEKTADVVLVADSRHLSGILAWWANLFNESHLYFALLTIVLIPAVGIILGVLADMLISRIGINLSSRALREG
jgi:hypothetical protein